MAHSVLLIGAGGSLGVHLVKEFIRQKDKFSRIAILASDDSKRSRFAEAEKSGIDIVIGSFLDVNSYKGKSPFERDHLLDTQEVQSQHHATRFNITVFSSC
jgi:hypothetical protein